MYIGHRNILLLAPFTTWSHIKDFCFSHSMEAKVAKKARMVCVFLTHIALSFIQMQRESVSGLLLRKVMVLKARAVMIR